tara:strand:- start:236 stop:481 length:246 start_codon:yes stop_codon:yes gene_type:complete
MYIYYNNVLKNNRGFAMKITKRQLKRIIKEEKAKLNEQAVPVERIVQNLRAIADTLEDVFGNNHIANTLRGQIDLLEKLER